jgi:hypothetical protein
MRATEYQPDEYQPDETDYSVGAFIEDEPELSKSFARALLDDI